MARMTGPGEAWKRPCFSRPAGVGQRMVTGLLLVRKLGIAKLDRPLLDVEAELGKAEGQLFEAAEEPDECAPVIGREITGCTSSRAKLRRA
jgi:hypothetical protein